MSDYRNRYRALLIALPVICVLTSAGTYLVVYPEPEPELQPVVPVPELKPKPANKRQLNELTRVLFLKPRETPSDGLAVGGTR